MFSSNEGRSEYIPDCTNNGHRFEASAFNSGGAICINLTSSFQGLCQDPCETVGKSAAKLLLIHNFGFDVIPTRRSMSTCVTHVSWVVQLRAFEGVVLEPPFKCDEDPLNSDCQMNASLRSSSMSFSVQSRVGKAWRNIMTSWKSILRSFSDHLTRKATHT